MKMSFTAHSDFGFFNNPCRIYVMDTLLNEATKPPEYKRNILNISLHYKPVSPKYYFVTSDIHN